MSHYNSHQLPIINKQICQRPLGIVLRIMQHHKILIKYEILSPSIFAKVLENGVLYGGSNDQLMDPI